MSSDFIERRLVITPNFIKLVSDYRESLIGELAERVSSLTFVSGDSIESFDDKLASMSFLVRQIRDVSRFLSSNASRR